MKKQKSTIVISMLIAMTLAGTISVPILYAQSGDEPTTTQTATQGGILGVLEQMRQTQAQQLEGSWIATVFPTVPPGAPQPSTSGYLSFARGGGLISYSRFLQFGSPQLGVWEHRGGNNFAFTFKQDIFDGMGNFVRVLTARGRLTLTGKDDLTASFSAESRDANGNVIGSGCGTLRATRLKVEPPAEQCQNLTPPQ